MTIKLFQLIDMKTKFKVGDKVLAIRNHIWGLIPMTIVKHMGDGYLCKNDNWGNGFFRTEDLEKSTDGRLSRIAKYNTLQDRLDKYRKRLFNQ